MIYIVAIIALIFIFISIKAAVRFDNIMTQLGVKRIFEIIPAIQNLGNKLNKANVILNELTTYFVIKNNTDIIKECRKLVNDKEDLALQHEKDLDILKKQYNKDLEEIKKAHTNELYEQSQIFKQKVREQKEKHEKEIDERNFLVDDAKNKTLEVSKKLRKLIEVIIKQNPDEDIEAIMKEFDAFYVLNAALLKWERKFDHQVEKNKRQLEIHAEHRKKHLEKERQSRRIYDRLRTVCNKYNEPMQIRKLKRRKPKKI